MVSQDLVLLNNIIRYKIYIKAETENINTTIIAFIITFIILNSKMTL